MGVTKEVPPIVVTPPVTSPRGSSRFEVQEVCEFPDQNHLQNLHENHDVDMDPERIIAPPDKEKFEANPLLPQPDRQYSNETDQPLVDEGSSDEEASDNEEQEGESHGIVPGRRRETTAQFWARHYRNLLHFFVEDWFLSAMLGIITAVLSISMDVAIEYIQHFRRELYDAALSWHAYGGFATWILWITVLVGAASLFCHGVSKQAVGSGIPEVKVIMHGFALKNYLTLKTLVAKIVSLTLTLGGGLPVGKEGPFVHMGAIVANLLNKATSACNYNAVFSNEGRAMEMLSSGCAVGIACTFSAPAGAVLYGIESTSKYFAVKNYWRSFFATTCSALIFRFAMAFLIPPHIAGTITAYYQTSFPTEVFLVEEIPFFILLGLSCGLMAATFIWFHRAIASTLKNSRIIVSLFGKSPIAYTLMWCIIVGVVTFPDGFGHYCAGQLTFRESLVHFLSNCTFTLANTSAHGCGQDIVDHWSRGGDQFQTLGTLVLFIAVYFVLVANCITLYIPSGIFVPAFVIGAATGRFTGEIISMWWPEGIRGLDGPQIYPGLYAVVGAAAYTGAVTHSLSIAVIVCETTGQLCALLPVLIALMVANAVCSFLQPSIYESIISIKGYPYLADLPPSRVSVHTMKVEKIMVKDIVYITRETTYKELRIILNETPYLKSYPFVTDRHSMNLLGSVSRKYLVHMMLRKLGPDPSFNFNKRRSFTASELLSTLGGLRRNSSANNTNSVHRPNINRNSWTTGFLTDRSISGNTLLAHSPLHDNQGERGPLASLLKSQNEPADQQVNSIAQRAAILSSRIDLDDVAIDPAPFQLVKGTSLYKVHTLFSLLALNHAYVTERGRLVGVVALKELREALANIYTRGAVAPKRKKNGASIMNLTDTNAPNGDGGDDRNGIQLIKTGSVDENEHTSSSSSSDKLTMKTPGRKEVTINEVNNTHN